MVDIFNGLGVLYHHAKFEEDRTMRAGCRCENIVFVCIYVFVTLRGRRAVRSRGYTLSRLCVAVYGSILMRFSAFQMSYIVLIFVASWRHNFREIAVKNCEKFKNRRKSLCIPNLRDFKKYRPLCAYNLAWRRHALTDLSQVKTPVRSTRRQQQVIGKEKCHANSFLASVLERRAERTESSKSTATFLRHHLD